MEPSARHQAPNSVILWLWLPSFLTAHIFAGYWLTKAFLMTKPHLRYRIRQIFGMNTEKDERLVETLRRQTCDNYEGELMDPTLCESPTPMKSRTAELKPAFDSIYDTMRSTTSMPEVERIELEWQALSCWYRTNTGNKWVLKNIYGTASPAEMQALIGPSGAGKSTLMDILAQRKSTGNLGGVLLVDGAPVDTSFIRRTAYVPQHDNFVPVMTTMETMQFYAGIILPAHWSTSRRTARIEEVLREMGLTSQYETLVGGQVPGGLYHRGLSGGERKRLCIAAGILARPSVVFLDEPTTGLDSFAALTVMSYMRRMARENGQIVIACIHQPRRAIWMMFNTVTLLSRGRLMYTGPCDGLVEWFRGIGFDYDAARHGVVSDWALDLVACGSHKPRQYYGHTITNKREIRTLSAHFVGHWVSQRASLCGHEGLNSNAQDGTAFVTIGHGGRSSPTKFGGYGGGYSGSGKGSVPSTPRSYSSSPQRGAPSPLGPHVRGSVIGGPPNRAAHSPQVNADRQALLRPSTWGQQFCSTFKRELIMITRNPAEVAGRTLTNSWVASAMGLLYYNIPNDSQALKGKVNMLLNILAFFCLMPYVSMSLYTASKKHYLADVSAKLYAPSSYYMAKLAATLPFQVVSSTTFTFVLYGMAGLRNSMQAIFQTGALATLMALIAIQVVHFCAVVAPTQDIAFMYSISWTAIQLLFNNFFITFKQVTLKWLTKLRYLSAVYYAYEGMAVTEFEGVQLACSHGDPVGAKFLRELLPNTKLLKLKSVQQGLNDPGSDCIADAGAVLEYFQFGRGFKETVGIMLGYWLVIHVLTYIALVVIARRERR